MTSERKKAPRCAVFSDPASQLAADMEEGRRHPLGISNRILCGVAVAWSLFQLWHASPLPFALNIGVFNDSEVRSVHLAFALVLAFAAFPARKRSPRDRIPVTDLVLAFTGAAAALYLLVFRDALAARAGAPIVVDLVVGGAGLAVLLEATRRAVGPPLVIVALVFLGFSLAGPWMPEVLAHKGVSFSRLISHQWLGTEGVFGVAIGVSAGFVFLFVLFGALLEQAGAGNYFIRLAYSLLGHLRGGPAKAAVAASGLSGMVSGSSIANVVTTGTFTIPLMKKVGFPPEKAGAIEVAASTNGQLTPPIMGAAAFLMVEYVGISYLEVIRHALLPALIAYIALFYIVHLEALKAGMPASRSRTRGLLAKLAGVAGGFAVTGGLAALLYYGLGWIKDVAGTQSIWWVSGLLAMAYLVMVRSAARLPEPAAELDVAASAPFLQVLRTGLHFILPVVVLVWNLVVERFSPGLAVFWATMVLAVVVVTQRPLKAWFRGGTSLAAWFQGLRDLHQGLVHGARNMVGIAIATATAGIVVGTVTLTGVGLMLTEFVEFISGGNLFLILLFTALLSLVLGMGLPTTANYIVVSSLMVPVIQTLGAEQGLVVPLIALHLFVFYFGILADDTPPVGLAAYAAAAISGGDPLRTGVQGFAYDIRTAILPFMFIFNTELLLIGIESAGHLLVTVAAAVAAMLLFAAVTQGYWLVRSRLWESLILLLVTFSLLRPGFWWDRVYPPQQVLPAVQIESAAEALPRGAELVISARGETLEGDLVERFVRLPMGQPGTGRERLADAGLVLRREDEEVVADMVAYGSPAQVGGIDLDWRILGVLVESDRPAKQWLYLVLVPLVGAVFVSQRRRRNRP